MKFDQSTASSTHKPALSLICLNGSTLPQGGAVMGQINQRLIKQSEQRSLQKGLHTASLEDTATGKQGNK
jgi:hypothetical protein